MKIMSKNTVYQTGSDGYKGYRIPSLIKAANGDILAFCEGRRDGLGDSGFIEIIVKRSTDNGMTWSEQHTVISDNKNTFGNCCCVLDKQTDRLNMVCNFNNCDGGEGSIRKGTAPRLAYYLYSDDDGLTWSNPKDITSMVKEDNWGWLAFGPCHGIQMESGRIAFGCNHSVLENDKLYSFVVYSDDGGNTFSYGNDVAVNTNECSIEQLNDGRIYINMRSYEKNFRRYKAYSNDEGETWIDYSMDEQLIDPICQGSTQYIKSSNILFACNSASKTRENMTLRLSNDYGISWAEDLVIYRGPSAYSDLIEIDKNTIGCLYEYGKGHPYEYIGYAVIDMER